MNKLSVLGLMSGSSLDGLDISSVSFQFIDHKIKWSVDCESVTIPYPKSIKDTLKKVASLNDSELEAFDLLLGDFFGKSAATFIRKNNLQTNYIASHGHTVRHRPAESYSLQIADGASMTKASDVSCITDFRTNDILAGGQGAPLAPVVEHYLFNEHSLFLNLGGIANLSIHKENEIIGYDICPANQLLNYLVSELELEYDDKGELAAQGEVDVDLLSSLKADPYHQLAYPKSLDNGYVQEMFIAKLNTTQIELKHKLATAVEYITDCISENVENLIAKEKDDILFVSGGGVYNDFLIKTLQRKLERVSIYKPSDEIIQFKESILMSLLGYLHVLEIPNSFASATGAKEDTINGKMFKKNNQ